MSDVAIAVPSTAEPMELPRSGTPEYAEWRNTGALPTSEPIVADPAPADTSKETPSDAPDSDPEPKQESRRKPGAEARIAELTAKNRQLEKDLEESRKSKEAKADPPPARQPDTRPKPKPEDQVDGKPKYIVYEDYVEDLADWKAEQRMATREREQAQAKQLESTTQKLNEARTRYEDYDSKAMPVVQELLKEGVSREVFSVLNDSPVLADLLYTIGGSEETKAAFLKDCRDNPGKALRVALLMEQEIVKELALSGAGKADRNDKGQFTPKVEVETPVKRGPESAAKPPIEIGNRGAGAGDDYAQALSDLDAGKPGAFQRLKALDDAKELRAKRGA